MSRCPGALWGLAVPLSMGKGPPAVRRTDRQRTRESDGQRCREDEGIGSRAVHGTHGL